MQGVRQLRQTLKGKVFPSEGGRLGLAPWGCARACPLPRGGPNPCTATTSPRCSPPFPRLLWPSVGRPRLPGWSGGHGLPRRQQGRPRDAGARRERLRRCSGSGLRGGRRRPVHNGLGGGGFALAYEAKTHKTLALDFREVAPAGASRDMYLRDGKVLSELSTDGALAIAVPGAAQGYLALLSRAGLLKPQVVMAPAIRLAKEGFRVTPKYQALARGRVACLAKNAEAAATFLRPGTDGTPAVPELGTVLKQPQLARTLERIAKEGASVVTRGSVAREIEETVRRAGGVLTAEDLAHYQVRWREPLLGSYRGHALAVFPLPTAGGVTVLQVLGMLEQLRPTGLERRGVEDIHLYIEALSGPTSTGRAGSATRASPTFHWPGFSPAPTWPRSCIPSTSTEPPRPASSCPAQRRPARRLPLWTAGGAKKHHPPLGHGPLGNTVALTTTLNGAFGSCVVAHGTGILLNNQMDDFAARPFRAQPLRARHRRRQYDRAGENSSLLDGPHAGVSKRGAGGGNARGGVSGKMCTIPTTVLQVISNVIDAKMDIERAVVTGRIHHQFMPDVLMVDKDSIDPSTKAGAGGHGAQLPRRRSAGRRRGRHGERGDGAQDGGLGPSQRGGSPRAGRANPWRAVEPLHRWRSTPYRPTGPHGWPSSQYGLCLLRQPGEHSHSGDVALARGHQKPNEGTGRATPAEGTSLRGVPRGRAITDSGSCHRAPIRFDSRRHLTSPRSGTA